MSTCGYLAVEEVAPWVGRCLGAQRLKIAEPESHIVGRWWTKTAKEKKKEKETRRRWRKVFEVSENQRVHAQQEEYPVIRRQVGPTNFVLARLFDPDHIHHHMFPKTRVYNSVWFNSVYKYVLNLGTFRTFFEINSFHC